MQVQGSEDIGYIVWLQKLNPLNNILGFWKMMHGGRVVYQFGDYKMEVNPAVETTSDHSWKVLGGQRTWGVD